MMKRRNFYLLTLIIVTVLELGDNTQGQHIDSPRPAKRLRVAVAQIPVVADIGANIETIGSAIDRAVAEKAEILLTPEGSLSGYTHRFDQVRVEAGLKKLVARASAADLALALGTCFVEPDDGRCYNQIRFYDADGKFLGFHAKTLRCGTMTKPTQGEINHYSARPLRTFQLKGITVGALICNDMWANPGCTPMPDPHLSQQLAEEGAKIIFHAVNGGRNGSEWSRKVYWPFHETNLRIRAQTGKLWIVTTDNCHPTNIPCSAPSGVIKPDGNWAVKMPDRAKQMAVYTIELQ
jgi:predicted amidohydrolase